MYCNSDKMCIPSHLLMTNLSHKIHQPFPRNHLIYAYWEWVSLLSTSLFCKFLNFPLWPWAQVVPLRYWSNSILYDCTNEVLHIYIALLHFYRSSCMVDLATVAFSIQREVNRLIVVCKQGCSFFQNIKTHTGHSTKSKFKPIVWQKS